MINQPLFFSYLNSKAQKGFLESTQNVFLKNAIGSGISFFLSAVYKNTKNPLLLVFDDREQAAYYFNDFEKIIAIKNIFYFPAGTKSPYEEENIDKANILLRSDTLSSLRKKKIPPIIVTYPEAIFEKIVSQKTLTKNLLDVHVGDSLSLDFITEYLFEYNFQKVDFVCEPGDFAVRGGIIDVFSFSYQHPYRIALLGDTINSIRTFNVSDQLSISEVDTMVILGNIQESFQKEERINLFESLPKDTQLVYNDFDKVTEKLADLFEKASQNYKALGEDTLLSSPEKLFISSEEFVKINQEKKNILLNKSSFFTELKEVDLHQLPQSSFNQNFDNLITYFEEKNQQGYAITLFCANEQQSQRFKDIFEQTEIQFSYQIVVKSIYQGFVDDQNKQIFFTDHQFFQRYYKYELKSSYTKKQALNIKELVRLEIGDYVTHIDHGIGQYGGLQQIENQGKRQEVVKLIYQGGDVLYVSVHSLHKISKYNGKEGTQPKIYKLGSKLWKHLKQKTKKKVKEIAFSLIQLYAERKQKKGFAYAEDSYLQHELEASFLFEDTPDQSKATKAVKEDMESEIPMDRLICGDVGFGKTEVAIRAAFKAAANGKQTAVLVPTTILAYQHFRTFSKRLENLPVKVSYLNRFRKAKDKKEIIEELKTGKIDIIIATHLLVSSKIEYKDLGLLIVDEEQKFGVAIKEKLKDLKRNIDVLTLTATPIPRTLQFSMMAARDLSVINTPPPNRYPVETEVIVWEEETLRNALLYELHRGGQIFFVHNRVDNISEVASKIQRLVPQAKIKIGHGQMQGKELEEIVWEFITHKFDILVATTIIENGLDVPNANTIFINNAQNFGLSDLHQMRGRVGRGNRKAFCYLIIPSKVGISTEGQKRIKAIEDFSHLGAGMQIAMRDLEIRGAGDLLGGEQSGFINEMGLETYQKVLDEAIQELKEKEFENLYKKEKEERPTYVRDFQLQTDIELQFPVSYINSISERLNLYQRLSKIENREELETFQKEVEDRFGKFPSIVEKLFQTVPLKWLAKSLGIEKINLRNNKLSASFITNPESAFYQSALFTKILNWVQQNPQIAKITEKETQEGKTLVLILKPVNTIEKAIEVLTNIVE